MISIRQTLTFARKSPRSATNVLSIIANNYCTEKSEKAEELKLSYLTGERQGIAVVELNRENGKNSLNRSLVSKLHHSVDVLGHDKNVRVVIIRWAKSKCVEREKFMQCSCLQELSERNFLRWSGFKGTTDNVATRGSSLCQQIAAARSEYWESSNAGDCSNGWWAIRKLCFKHQMSQLSFQVLLSVADSSLHFPAICEPLRAKSSWGWWRRD